MKKSITILSCAFALTALMLGMTVSDLDSKESKSKTSSKTSAKVVSEVTEISPAKSSVTRKQPEVKAAITSPLSAPSGIMVTGETISWEVLAGGGQFGTSTNFGLSGTIGEGAVGDGFSTNFGVLGGFEQNFSAGAPPCCVLPGNASGDDKTNIADVSFVIAWLFLGGADPGCCAQASANGDNKLNIADVTYIIAWLFTGGADPVCGPADMTC
ncbi:MAG: hypothetical protein IH914_10140 [candidate division Zixibacteria bacterium]|nr:hypothetical protein [candidate division Zixibacteria bacterium]